ncbi:hypothetical protein RUMCAL_02663 [Ruminococcus callidus ATCC 27760]|uniref:Uncharacterized protein n=1 Tax=Ruminococcus callidus ATCC 27760 TaxID=411473 RepID=U2KGF4_9FIRM|nr:hypothetical protein RUMCAL_02663 [Ruminococcus callidus ATCC 27760]
MIANSFQVFRGRSGIIYKIDKKWQKCGGSSIKKLTGEIGQSF